MPLEIVFQHADGSESELTKNGWVRREAGVWCEMCDEMCFAPECFDCGCMGLHELTDDEW